MTEKSFKIDVPEDALGVLQRKLELSTFPDELDDAAWEYGVPLAGVKRLVARWKGGYDWRHHERILNLELPQFTRDIEVEGYGTLNIHYVHQKSTVSDAIPLLFVHGWPGSFIEVRKILPLLIEQTEEHPSFHVVAFSLPGYAWSEATTKKGFELKQYAEVGNKLMISLGYDEYVTQGGDWGSLITRTQAQLFGHTHVKAWHTNLPFANPPHPIHRPLLLLSHLLFSYSPRDQQKFDALMKHQSEGIGYFGIQSTKPQTLGYSLADSPVGLLAWIYEKLVSWTNSYEWDDDEVLTWVSIYWFSRAGPTASIRIYYEFNKFYSDHNKKRPTTIPMGHSYFAKEFPSFPRSWLQAPNLVFEADHPNDGGHFAAHEVPHLLVGDLRKMFGRHGPAYGVVPGKAGYAPNASGQH